MSGEPKQDIDSAKSGDDQTVTPGTPVEHTDLEDGKSVGHSAEPEHTEGSQGNQETPDGTAPPGAEDVPSPVPPPKVSRDDIYKNAQEQREAEITGALDEMTDDERRHYDRMVAEAGGGEDPFAQEEQTAPPEVPPADPNAVRPTTTDQPDPNAVQPTQTVDPQGQEIVTERVDENNETTTIIVYGMREDVPTAEVDAAGGVNAYQKQRAADIRMERLATYEASLRNYEEQLSERAAALEQGAQAPAGEGTGATESSPTDAQGDTADVDVLAAAIADSIYSGDPDEAKKAIAGALSSIKEDATRSAQAQASAATPSGPSQQELDSEARSRDEANAVFRDEFQDLNNPTLKAAALNMVHQVARDPVMAGRPLSEITREACLRVREDVYGSRDRQGPAPGNPTPPATPASVDPLLNGQQPAPTDLAGRHELKRRTVVTPINEATGRAPAPEGDNEQTYPTNSQYVAQMKRGRGQHA